MSQAIITALKALKLHGMAANYPEVAAQARHTEFSPEAFLGQLLRAEQAERTVRSMAYQMGAARFPAHRDLAGFEFGQAGVDEALVRTLHGGQFIDAAHNVVLLHLLRCMEPMLAQNVRQNFELLYARRDMLPLVSNHRTRVFEAIMAGEPEQAREASHRHLAFIEEILLDRSREQSRRERSLRRIQQRKD